MLLHDLFISLLLAAFSRHPFLYKLADPKVFRSPTSNNRVHTIQLYQFMVLRGQWLCIPHMVCRRPTRTRWSFSKHCLFCCSLCEASQGKNSGFIVSSGHTLDTWVPEMQKTALHLFLTLSHSLQMTLSMGRAHPFRLTKVKRMSNGVSHVTGTNMLLSDRI